MAARGRCAGARSAEPETALAASRALFGEVVEPLADSFDPAQAEAYAALFERVLTTIRSAPGFEAIDEALAESPNDAPPAFDPRRIRRAVVLSRVTLGADIAVTSVFLRTMLDHPARPEVFFAAGPKNLAMFAGEPRVSGIQTPYPRAGGLRERLLVWLDARRAIAAAADGLAPGELLILDPDSRITQLGLLPLAPLQQHYFAFNSRCYREGEDGPLGALAAEWLEEHFGAGDRPPLPWIAPPPADLEQAQHWRPTAGAKLAAINFGVGGNAAKSVAAPFEKEAALALAEKGFVMAVDAGFGEEEERRAAELVDSLPPGTAKLHRGSFSSFAAVLSVADLFLGYDSGAAHAAAALGIRAIDVFAGAPTERMRSRWSPWGKRPALVLPVDQGEAAENVLWRLRELL
ncbi:MAG: glycosyltransferase family 9 protein [Bryobacterales bacterium]